MLCQFFDVVADHGSIDDGDTNLVFANRFLGLLQGVCVVHIVHAARGFLDRSQELVVFRDDEDIDGRRTHRR